MINFYTHVYTLVRRVPPGKVVTYGQIAAMISSARAARQVGAALRALPAGSDVPWHRVVGNKGIITIQNLEHPAEEQANLLMAEGVRVHKDELGYRLNLEEYLWKMQEKQQIL